MYLLTLFPKNPQGTMRQVLTALIVHGLLVLFNQAPSHFSPKQLWRQLEADIHQAIFDFAFQLGLEQGRQQASLQIQRFCTAHFHRKNSVPLPYPVVSDLEPALAVRNTIWGLVSEN